MYMDTFPQMQTTPFSQPFPRPTQTMMGTQGFYQQSYISQLMPLVDYGLNEGQRTGMRHAMMEVALISYLMGRGLSLEEAYRLVESWEVNEQYPMYR